MSDPAPLVQVQERRKTPEAQRELARSLYYQGKTRAFIAAQVGVEVCTIDSWRKRHKWTGNRNTNADDSHMMLPASAVARIIPKETTPDTLRPATRAYLEAIAPQLPKKLPKDARGFKDAMQGISAYVSSCKLVEGWSDTNIASINIEVLGREPQEVCVNPQLGVQPYCDNEKPKEIQLPASDCGSTVAQKACFSPSEPTGNDGATPLLTTPEVPYTPPENFQK